MSYLPRRTVRFRNPEPEAELALKPSKLGELVPKPQKLGDLVELGSIQGAQAAQYLLNLRIYKQLCDYLKSTLLEAIVSPESREAWDLYFACLLDMKNLDSVASLIVAQNMRIRLLEVSTVSNLSSTTTLLDLLQKDEIAIGYLLIQTSTDQEEKILSLKDQRAAKFLNLMHYILDKNLIHDPKDNRLVHRLLVKLSKVSKILPHTISIEGVTVTNTTPVARGGFADIFRGQYGKSDVALKRLIIKEECESRDIPRDFRREALIWQQLRHQNILPFLGVTLPVSLGLEDPWGLSQSLCMVSPWMRNGTICDFRRVNGAQNINIPRRIVEISGGLAYLHSEGIIHGDLRGSNILVDDSGQACLADFGLAFFNDSVFTRTSNRRGSLRWMAPELLSPESLDMCFQRTQETDTYAFACVCIEIYAGAEPFAGVHESAVIWQVVQKKLRPRRPTGQGGVGDTITTVPVSIEMPDSTWDLIERCWTQEPKTRPKMADVLADLKAAQDQKRPTAHIM